MKLKSYLLLFVLIVILFFILGVRYGQKVEKTNKTINYILSITPKITFTPNEVPTTSRNEVGPTPIKYATYESKLKKINKIIYPTNWKIKENATQSSILIEP